ncbi:MAG: LemA family protein [Verrucomicrobiota bacterium]
MELLLILIVILAIIAVIIPIVMYNGLVGARNKARNSFSTIDVNLKKRHDLIPNLVETVKAYASHEQETLAQVIDARNQAQAAGGSMGAQAAAEDQLSGAVGRLFAVSESYPDLRSSDQFLNLQRNLTEVEEQISAARRAYNAAVLSMNNKVESFPTNLIASKFGFKALDFFEAGAGERDSVSVKF